MQETPATLTVSAHSRPLRVAYLVDPDNEDPGAFDAILESVMDRWGGRRRGIFPLLSGNVPEPWWSVMEALDPDLVFSTTKLSDELQDKIVRRILPYRIQELELQRAQHDGARWRLNRTDAGVDVLGVPRAVPTQKWTGAGGPHFAYIFEEAASSTGTDRSFILRNFGILPKTVGVRSAFEGLSHRPLDCDGMTATGILEAIASMGRDPITPVQLATLEAPTPWMALKDLHAHSGFHFVVGETVRDAILAWNRGLFLDPARKTLWAPFLFFEAPGFLEGVGRWLQSASWGHDETCVLVSYEHSAAQLEPLAIRLRAALGHPVRTRALSADDYPFPAIDHENRRAGALRWGRAASRATIEHVPFSKGGGTIAVAQPPFSDASFPQGEWMVDVLIPHRPELHLHQSNAPPTWTLPKRPGIGPSFFGVHQARITAAGLPSARVDGGCKRLELQIPSDRRLFWECLAPSQAVYGTFDPFKKRLLTDFAPSIEGRAVRGIIDVFGSLWACGRTLSDPFWRSTFALLSGQRTVVHSDRRALLLSALRGYLEKAGVALTNVSRELPDVAEVLAKTLLETEPKRPWVTLRDMTRNFSRLRKDRLLAPSATDDGNFWEAENSFGEHKKRELHEFIEGGVFALGCAPECPRCGSTNWFAIEDVRASMVCPGCANKYGLPLEPSWSYRLNTLVEKAFRTSGALASLQALHNAESLCLHEPFVYLSPQDFAVSTGGSREADILCFWNGHFVIGEVKSQSRAFREDDLERMRTLARELRPDRIWFAAPQQDWPPETTDAIKALAVELAPLGVIVEEFRLGWWQMTTPTPMS